MLDRLAAIVFSRPRRVLGIGVALMVIGGVVGTPVVGMLSSSTSGFEDSRSESVLTRGRLERASGVNPEVGMVALVRLANDVENAADRARLAAVADAIEADEAVARVTGFLDTRDPAFVSHDRRASYLLVAMEQSSDEAAIDAAERIEAQFAGEENVTFGGRIIASQQVGEQVSRDLARAEMLAFPLLFLLSLVLFRGLVASALPLLTGGLTILLSFLALRVVNELASLSVFAVNLVIGLSLGLAIDYSLLIVSRYREEIARFGPGFDAMRTTLRTAGRTVAYSALTVAVAMAALLVFPQPFLYSMGAGGIVAALVSGVAALTVLPAVLALLGTRVNALAPDRWKRRSMEDAGEGESGFWYRLATTVMRRPGRIAIASGALLIVLGLPFLRVEFTSIDSSVLPKSTSARQVSDALETEFPTERTAPIYLSVDAPTSNEREVLALARQVGQLPDAVFVTPPRRAGPDLWRVDVISSSSGLEDSSLDLVRSIRNLDSPFEIGVGGFSASFIDQRASLAEHLPAALAILIITTLLLLFAVTGSVVLPVKALLMNVLTLSAAFGLMVLVFQDGRLEGLLDFTSQGALEMTQPILLFGIAFALSTDYAIFLLTRIKEARDSGLSNTESVARGLERTGRIVTSAALLFTVAIGAFATSEIVFIKLLGLGTAVAVILDATIVRALLVPSLMAMLGEWNWWAPRPLRRLHDRFGLREL